MKTDKGRFYIGLSKFFDWIDLNQINVSSLSLFPSQRQIQVGLVISLRFFSSCVPLNGHMVPLCDKLQPRHSATARRKKPIRFE